MKQMLVMIAAAVLVGQSVQSADEKPLIANPIVEKAIRKSLKKPTGELIKADLAKATYLDLSFTQITDAGLGDVAKLQQLTTLHLGNTKITDADLTEVAKLQQLTFLGLNDTQVTDAGVAELQKALPNCRIRSNATK
jgi:hypothetical protein